MGTNIWPVLFLPSRAPRLRATPAQRKWPLFTCVWRRSLVVKPPAQSVDTHMLALFSHLHKGIVQAR